MCDMVDMCDMSDMGDIGDTVHFGSLGLTLIHMGLLGTLGFLWGNLHSFLVTRG